jgi:hypothetical protein
MPDQAPTSVPRPSGHKWTRLVFALLLILVVFGAGWLAGTVGIGRRISPASLTDLERRFTDRMKGAALVGQFTIVGREDRPASPERYEISSVEKLSGSDWRFNARIKYAKVDVTLPIVVSMVWAGDTPMITMTDVSIPTLGTFTARVIFYGDRYAGTWQHGAFGGHMFGVIEKSDSSQ